MIKDTLETHKPCDGFDGPIFCNVVRAGRASNDVSVALGHD